MATIKPKFYKRIPIKKEKLISDRAFFQYKRTNEETWSDAPSYLRTFEEVKAFVAGKHGKEFGCYFRLIYTYQKAHVFSWELL